MESEIVERLPSAEEYNQLREMVGWSTYEHEVIEKALPNSLYCVCVSMDDKTVGMARVIGDAGLTYYILDVIVIPEYQKQGIGTAMMDKVMGFIRNHAAKNSIVALMAAKGRESFYEQYGFVQRPNDRLGCGMTIFWADDTAHSSS
ncbi:MAG: GNAT family N-acetyltransferase [Anaerolineae bacterium]|nr:GNAT family N-acetyltransferase [Anaerolineae bacterium]